MQPIKKMGSYQPAFLLDVKKAELDSRCGRPYWTNTYSEGSLRTSWYFRHFLLRFVSQCTRRHADRHVRGKTAILWNIENPNRWQRLGIKSVREMSEILTTRKYQDTWKNTGNIYNRSEAFLAKNKRSGTASLITSYFQDIFTARKLWVREGRAGAGGGNMCR